MPKIPYKKPFLLYSEQLQQLKDRGLKIEDDAKALHLLKNLSYYRLSGYWHPLLSDKQTHQFKPDATFNTAFELYCFDRELRMLVLSNLEKIEVAFRAEIAYILSHSSTPFWFLDSRLFKNTNDHAKLLSKIRGEYSRSDDQFVRAFKDNYTDSIAPAWITMEVCSFGMLSRLYKNLKPGKDKRVIANQFYLSDTVLETWLHSLVYVRNVCAHHARLWNREMRIQPSYPRRTEKQWLSDSKVENNRTYFVLSTIIYLLNTVNPNHSFQSRFTALLNKYRDTIDVHAMGFPTDWYQERLWQ